MTPVPAPVPQMQPEDHKSHLTSPVQSEGLPPAPPFGSVRAAALALYSPPFKFHNGYIHDSASRMVADQDGWGEGSKVFDSVAARVRGWGRIGYLPDPEKLQDEVGAIIAEALTAFWASAHPSAAPSAEAIALEKDALRYRRLREPPHNPAQPWCAIADPAPPNYTLLWGPALDAAIDDAMAQKDQP